MATNYMERLQIPDGYEELLHDLIKEVLREQPKDIIRFCYQYFHKKKYGTELILKTQNQEKKMIKQVSIEGEFSNKDIQKEKGILTTYLDNVKDEVINDQQEKSLPTGVATAFFDTIKEDACEKIIKDSSKELQ